MITRAVARHLDAIFSALVFRPDGPGGNLFVQDSPAEPDLIVSVMGTGGLPQLTLDPSDSPTVQIIVRAPEGDIDAGYDLARAIYGELNGLTGLWLAQGTPDEVWLITCTAQQSEPTPMGVDANGRPEFTQNFALQTHNPTTHRD